MKQKVINYLNFKLNKPNKMQFNVKKNKPGKTKRMELKSLKLFIE